jgi:hypothetical protein
VYLNPKDNTLNQLCEQNTSSYRNMGTILVLNIFCKYLLLGVCRNCFFGFVSNIFLDSLKSPVWNAAAAFTLCAVTKNLFLPFLSFEVIPPYVLPGLEKGGGATGLQANIAKPWSDVSCLERYHTNVLLAHLTKVRC